MKHSNLLDLLKDTKADYRRLHELNILDPKGAILAGYYFDNKICKAKGLRLACLPWGYHTGKN